MTPNHDSTTSATNRYGILAREHLARWSPRRYGQIPDPDEYFETLGHQILNEIEQLEHHLLQQQNAASAATTSTFDAKMGRANMARMMAEERVLTERVFAMPEPESTEPTADETGAWIGPSPQIKDWIPLHGDAPGDPTTSHPTTSHPTTSHPTTSHPTTSHPTS